MKRLLLVVALLPLPLRAIDPVSSHGEPPRPVGADKGRSGVVAPVTFYRDVIRILQDNCQKCHREGGIAPFPLVTYDDAVSRAELIVDKTARREMPPWKPSKACSTFVGDPSLTQAQIDTLHDWLHQGVAPGRAADAPPAPTFDDGFVLGVPDAVLQMPEFTPDLRNGDVYRCFSIPTNAPQDGWLSAMEVIPGNRTAVHHVLLFSDESGESKAFDDADPGPGYACFGGTGGTSTYPMGAWVPGYRPQFLPSGVGIPVKKGQRVIMQVHYSALTGGNGPDRTTVGLYAARSTIHKRLITLPMADQIGLRIPAGQANYEHAISGYSPAALHLLGVAPHMHLLGKSMQAELTFPNGTKVCLVDVPSWDFRWQGFYSYPTQLAVPFAARVDLRASYDNSATNPNNPNRPPKTVTWGEQTTDEMFLCYLLLTVDAEDLAAGAVAPTPYLLGRAPETD